MTDALFEGFDDAIVPEKLTAGERRRRRVLVAIEAGQHPLSLVVGQLRLHADPTLTCGSCVHRYLTNAGTAGTYPKCDVDERATRSEATDVRAWWPACRDHEVKP